MKRCPACNTTYGDEQNFCLNDGSVLVPEASGSYGAGAQTENLPYNARTEVMYGTPTAPPVPPSIQQRPPAQPSPYMQTAAPRRSLLPWIFLGVLVVAGIVVAVIFFTRGSGTDTASSGGTSTTTTTNSSTTNGTRTSNAGITTNTSTTTTTTSSGTTYDSPDGRFTITLPPGFPQFTSQTKTQPTAVGPVELNMLQSQTSDSSAVCVLGYSDFPEASFQGRSPQKMLEDGRDGALRNMGATLEKQDNLTVQGRTAINVYGSMTEGGRQAYVRFEFILDKPRAYQIGYLSYNRADLDKPSVQAYYDSFRIKESK